MLSLAGGFCRKPCVCSGSAFEGVTYVEIASPRGAQQLHEQGGCLLASHPAAAAVCHRCRVLMKQLLSLAAEEPVCTRVLCPAGSSRLGAKTALPFKPKPQLNAP